MGVTCTFYLVRQRIAFDHQPRSATRDVMPVFGMGSAGIGPQIHGIVPFVRGRIQCRIGDCCVAAVAKLAVVSIAAKRTGDNDQGSILPKQTVEKTA